MELRICFTIDKYENDMSHAVHEISNSVVYATSKGWDQPAHTRSLIRAFASRLSILLIEHHFEFLSLKGVCRCSSESTLVKLLEISCRGSIIFSLFETSQKFIHAFCLSKIYLYKTGLL